MDTCKFKYHCNDCYGTKFDTEGCFTNDVDKLKAEKQVSCLNGDWDETDPETGERIPGSCVAKPTFKPNKLYKG